MNEKCSITFENLCLLPQPMHLYLFDREHRVLKINNLQLSTVSKLCGAKSVGDLQGLELTQVYSHDYKHVERLYEQNEFVLKTGSLLHSIDYITIPNDTALKLQTTKMPYYDKNNKIQGILGVSYYERQIDLAKANAYHLTTRELDCLDLTLLNKTAKEIASFLTLSVRTVEDYLSQIKHKLNCETKLELIKKVKDMNLIKRYLLPQTNESIAL